MSQKEHYKYFLKIQLSMQKVIKLDKLNNIVKFFKREIILILLTKTIVSIQILLLNLSKLVQMLSLN